ncbi:unnamed protein product [marine sediment metagenome]|uniref:NYN domain-containing protein n=1 Tax=marine sediment metagenome TaxID=412755 RepID=X1I0F9_9ZZZZ
MKHYIIDGYNALFKIKPLLKKSYQTRDGFIQYIMVTKPFGSIKNRVSIVFDGSKDVINDKRRPFPPIDVIFSKNETADDTIVRMVKKERKQGEIIVVTDDREVKEKVKLLGCSTLSILEFFKNLTEKKERTDKDKPDPRSKEGKKITEELKRIWKVDEK